MNAPRKPIEDFTIRTRTEAAALSEKFYYTGKPCKHGHVSHRYTTWGTCLACSRDSAVTSVETKRARLKNYKQNRPDLMMFWRTRKRAAVKGIPFTLTLEDIRIPERCPCCDTRMAVGAMGQYPRGPQYVSPSLDRLDPRKGYIPSNIAVICWRCNSLKKDASIEELETIVAWMKSVSVQKTAAKLFSIGESNG